MLRRIPVVVLLGVLAFAVACTNKKVSNPIADVDSKQPDKVLFDRSMNAMKHNQFDVARMTLQTLINTYPDSEFLARAKLALGDSWYAEGGATAMAQAEAEYDDFITFFPNMPEAAEAQLKIANIHFNENGKAGPGLYACHAGGRRIPQGDPAISRQREDGCGGKTEAANCAGGACGARIPRSGIFIISKALIQRQSRGCGPWWTRIPCTARWTRLCTF